MRVWYGAMSDSQPQLSEGMASLQVAQAHLATLLTESASLDSKAGWLAALNLALYAVMFGALLASDDASWWAIAAPSGMATIVLCIGWWTLRPRRLQQFIHPLDLMQLIDLGRNDHELAWSYVLRIGQTSDAVAEVVKQKGMSVRLLGVASLLHIVSIASSTIAWFT